MTITKLTTDLNNISALPDNPALTSREFKAKYDEAGNEIKTYINDIFTEESDALIDGLNLSKRDSSDVYALLYSDTTGFKDGSEITISGISNYNIFIFEFSTSSTTDFYPMICQFNNDKTNLTGIGELDVASFLFPEMYFQCDVETDTLTNIQFHKLYHTENDVHSTLTTSEEIHKVYGVI